MRKGSGRRVNKIGHENLRTGEEIKMYQSVREKTEKERKDMNERDDE